MKRGSFRHRLKISQHSVLWRAGFAEPIWPFGDIFLGAPNTLLGCDEDNRRDCRNTRCSACGNCNADRQKENFEDAVWATCKNCGSQFDVESSHPACPQCGGEDFELLPGAPLVLEEIYFQTD